MLPAPIWPLAEHADFGQNCFDASIDSAVFVCICTSCRWIPLFSSFPPSFHRLVGLYQSAGYEMKNRCFFSFSPFAHFLPETCKRTCPIRECLLLCGSCQLVEPGQWMMEVTG